MSYTTETADGRTIPVPSVTVMVWLDPPSPTLDADVLNETVGRSSLTMVTVCEDGEPSSAPEGADIDRLKVSLASNVESLLSDTTIVCVAPFVDPAGKLTDPLDAV